MSDQTVEAKSLNSPFELSSLARENHRPYLTMQGYRRLEPMTFQDKRVQAIEFEAGWRAAVDEDRHTRSPWRSDAGAYCRRRVGQGRNRTARADYATGAQDFAGQPRRRTENDGDRRALADEVIE